MEERARAIVSYRRAGGMAGLDQRLSVYEDGRVVLNDRKSRSRSEVQATATELARLHALIASVPANLWHGPLKTIGQALLPRPHESMRFELHSAHGRMTGNAGTHDAELGPLLAELDELLGRAVRERRGFT